MIMTMISCLLNVLFISVTLVVETRVSECSAANKYYKQSNFFLLLWSAVIEWPTEKTTQRRQRRQWRRTQRYLSRSTMLSICATWLLSPRTKCDESMSCALLTRLGCCDTYESYCLCWGRRFSLRRVGVNPDLVPSVKVHRKVDRVVRCEFLRFQLLNQTVSECFKGELCLCFPFLYHARW